MRKGQVLTAALLLFAIVALYTTFWLKEAIGAIQATKVLWSGLQSRLLCQSGIAFAAQILRQGEIPQRPLTFLLEDEQIHLTFTPERLGTKVIVKAVSQVKRRRFELTETFSFPSGLGQEAISVFHCDPQNGNPLTPVTWLLGRGLTKASLVIPVDGHGQRITLTGGFLGVEPQSLLGVSDTGNIIFGKTPNQSGIFTFDGWWQVPALPGPFLIAFPFFPLIYAQVRDEKGEFRRVEVIPRFPRQYFLDDLKGHFFFSEHEAGRSVLISGWQRGVRIYGGIYANADLYFEGTSLTALLPSRGDAIRLVGKVRAESQWYVVSPHNPLLDWTKERDEAKKQGLVQEGASPRPRPQPGWEAWRMLAERGEGVLLPAFSILDLSAVEEDDLFFFAGDGFVRGELRDGKGWVVVISPGVLTLLGNINVGAESNLAFVAKDIVWVIEPDRPVQMLKALLWATDGTLQVFCPSDPTLPFPLRLLFVGSINVNEVPMIEDERGRWGVEMFFSPSPFPSFLVQPIQDGGEQP